MAAHSIKTVQKIPISLEKAWNFFSNPANLQAITPGNMGFKVISKHHDGIMYAGQIIEYTVKPFLAIPVYWMTEITRVKDKEYFIDEQRLGPYSLWHHQHHFREVPGGVQMTDIVHYKNPFWFIGQIANTLFVKKKLDGIFAYRYKKVKELFGEMPDNSQGFIRYSIDKKYPFNPWRVWYYFIPALFFNSAIGNTINLPMGSLPR